MNDIKRFIVKFLLTMVLPCTCFAVVAEILLRRIPNDYSYKNEWLLENSNNIKTLILGNSYTYYGINPENIEQPSFSATHVSQSFKYDYFIFNKFIDKMDSLQTIILPITYFNLFNQLEGIEDFRIKKYMIYYDCDFYPYCPKYNIEFDANAGKRLKSYYINKKEEIYCNQLGYGLKYSLKNRSTDWENTGKLAEKRHTINSEENMLKMSSENLSWLNRILNKCNERNITVLLVTTPTWHTYYENLNEKQLEILHSICKQLTKHYDNIVYMDLMRDTRFNEDDFFDTDHMSDIGAIKLTEIIQSALIKNSYHEN